MGNTILFDMDGTLIDTEPYYQKTWKQAINEHGYELTQEQCLMLRSFGRPFCIEQFHEWYGEGFDYWSVLNRRRALVDELIENEGLHLKPFVKSTLLELSKMGNRLAVVTATGLERTEKNLKMVGLHHLFDEIVCGPMVEYGKPAPDIYIYACEQLNISPSEAYAVEDSPNGVRSASDAGCKVIMVPDLTQPDSDIEQLLYCKVDAFKDLLEVIK